MAVDQFAFSVGNDSFASRVTVTLDFIEHGDDGTKIGYSLSNQPYIGGGFNAAIELAVKVDGSSVDTQSFTLFTNSNKSYTTTVTGLQPGDHEVCVEVTNRSNIEK